MTVLTKDLFLEALRSKKSKLLNGVPLKDINEGFFSWLTWSFAPKKQAMFNVYTAIAFKHVYAMVNDCTAFDNRVRAHQKHFKMLVLIFDCINSTERALAILLKSTDGADRSYPWIVFAIEELKHTNHVLAERLEIAFSFTTRLSLTHTFVNIVNQSDMS